MISPNTFPSSPQIPLLHASILASPSNWYSAFASHLNITHPRPPTAALPTLVNLSPPPLLQWPISHDSELFITNFGHLVRTAPSLRLLAASALFALSQKHNLDLNPRAGIESGQFYAAAFPPHNFEDSASTRRKVDYGKEFLTAAEQVGLSTLYLSTSYFSDANSLEAFGVKGEVEGFSKLAANRSIQIETAESLLGGALPAPFLEDDNGPMLVQPERKGASGFESEWTEYQALSVEQKEAVDYEVLVRGSLFGGSWEGGLSWGVALRRHVIASGGNGKWNSLSGTEVGKSRIEKGGGVDRVTEGLERRAAKIVDFAAEKAAEAELEKAKAAAAIPPPGATEAATKTGVAKPKTKTKTRPTKTASGRPKATGKTGKLDAGKGKGKISTGGGGVKEKVDGKVADHCFRDELSVIFGPRGKGKVWILGGWP
jgi:hypothetical protein